MSVETAADCYVLKTPFGSTVFNHEQHKIKQ